MMLEDNSIKDDDLPEEAVVAIWWALREIKKEYLATSSGEQVYIRFTGSVQIIGQPKTIPDIEEQKQAVRILEKIGALKIDQYTHYTSTKVSTYASPTGVYLNVLQPEFDTTYKKYQKLSTQSFVEDKTQTIDQERFKPENDKWLDDLSSNSLRNLSKILLILRQFHEESGKDKFQIPYQQLHDAGVEGSIQNWLKNLHQRGVITIINWENKVNGPMAFSVEAPYDENETDHIYPGAKIEIHLEKFKGAYLWLKENHYIKDENKETEPSNTSVEKDLVNQTQSEDSKVSELTESGVIETDNKPSGWELIKDGIKAYLKKEGEIGFTFPTNWSRKFKYFEYLWNHYGEKIDYKVIYESCTSLDYPKKGEIWKVNKAIRNEVNKLRKELQTHKLPIHIETARGLTLTIAV